MQTRRTLLTLTCALSVTAAVFAQATKPASTGPAMPPAGPVIKQIPAGAMGFAVVNNIQTTMGNVEKFVEAIGVGALVPVQQPGGLVDMIKNLAMLGEGFNPNGGFAAVMLDPQQYGIDLAQLVPGGGLKAEELKLPFVLFIPGKGVKEVFGNYPMEQEGEYTKVHLRMGEMLAGTLGDYVILSPLAKALDAVKSAQGKATSELGKEQMSMLERSDVGFYVNMKITGPIYAKILMKMEEQMFHPGGPKGGEAFMNLAQGYFAFAREMLAQVDSVTLAGRFGKTGVIIEAMETILPDSDIGKMMASTKVSGQPKLDRLPDLSYVLAMGTASASSPESQKFVSDLIEKAFKNEAVAKAIPQDSRDKIKQILLGFTGEVTGAQFVGGGSTEGSGLFGLDLVLQCNSAEKVKALLADSAATAESTIKAMAGDNADMAKLTVTYNKAAEKAGETAVDNIEISHPDLTASEEDRDKMTKVLGEDKLRIRVATVDDKTVVVTFGGGLPFMVEAAKTASKGGGTILTGVPLAEVTQYLPKDRTSVAVFNVGNLLEVIRKGAKTMEPDSPVEAMLPKLTTKTPIVMAGAIQGTSTQGVIYVPNDLVKEIVGAFLQMRGAIMGPGSGMAPTTSPRKGEDF